MPSWLIQSERVVLPDGVRPATHPRRGRPDRGSRTGTRGHLSAMALCPRSTPARRRAAGARRHPRPHQRSRPRRLGRLRNGERARRRPAASPRSSTCRSTAFRPPRPSRGSTPSGARRTGRCHVDVGFWGGVVPGNAASSSRSRAPASSASSAFSARPASTSSSTSAKRICATRCRSSPRLGLPLLVHAEWPALLRRAGSARRSAQLRDVAGQPAATAEQAAIELLIEAGRATTARGAHRAPRLGRRARVDWRRAGERVCRSRSRPARTT